MPSTGSGFRRGHTNPLMRRTDAGAMSEDNQHHPLLFDQHYYHSHVTNTPTDDGFHYNSTFTQSGAFSPDYDVFKFNNMSPSSYYQYYSPGQIPGLNPLSSDVDSVAVAMERLAAESPIGVASALTASQETVSMPPTPADDPPLDFDFPTNLKNFPSASAAGSALFPDGFDAGFDQWITRSSQPPRQQQLTVDTAGAANYTSDVPSTAPASVPGYGSMTAPHTAPVNFQRSLASPVGAQGLYMFSPSTHAHTLGQFDGHAIGQGASFISQSVGGFSHMHSAHSFHAGGAQTDRWSHSNAQLPNESIDNLVPPPSSAPAQCPDPSFQFYNHRQLTPLHEGHSMDAPHPSPPSAISPQVLTSSAIEVSGIHANAQVATGPSRSLRGRPSPSPYHSSSILPPISRFSPDNPRQMRAVLQSRIEDLVQSPKSRNSKEDEVYLQNALTSYADIIVKFGESPRQPTKASKNGVRAKESRVDKNKPGNFVCFFCAQDITSKQNLFKHLKSVHLKLKTVQCDQCHAFLAGDLSRHKKTCQKTC